MNNKFLLFLSFSLIITGCSGNEFKSTQVKDQIQNSLDTIQESCEAPNSKYNLNTDIVSLQIESKNNINFGFDLLGIIRLFKTSFITKKGIFNLEMSVTDSLNEAKLLATGSGSSVMRQNEFSFSFNIDQFGISFENFSQTPLAELTKRGLSSTLDDLKSDFDQNTESWSSVVKAVIEDELYTDIIVASGKASNLKVGDLLSFYNVEHIWSGKPCESEYIFSRRLSEEPSAIGEVILTRNHAAQIRVRSKSDEASSTVNVGDEVKSYSLLDETRPLKQSITISKIERSILEFENKNFDLTPYLIKQIKSLAADRGFVVYDSEKD